MTHIWRLRLDSLEVRLQPQHRRRLLVPRSRHPSLSRFCLWSAAEAHDPILFVFCFLTDSLPPFFRKRRGKKENPFPFPFRCLVLPRGTVSHLDDVECGSRRSVRNDTSSVAVDVMMKRARKRALFGLCGPLRVVLRVVMLLYLYVPQIMQNKQELL